MLKIAIILGSTRPGRKGEAVAHWFLEKARAHGGAEYELVDLKDFDLPLFDEPASPKMQKYTHEHTKRWAAKIAPFDGFIFVTPEYNHSTSGVLKNAIDYLAVEWADKAAGFVAYGSSFGARAVEHLRLILAELKVATVRTQVGLSIFSDWENFTAFKPGPQHEANIKAMLNELTSWSRAMKTLRSPAADSKGV